MRRVFFFFFFDSVENGDCILEKGVWMFLGRPFRLKKWEMGIKLQKEAIRNCQFGFCSATYLLNTGHRWA